MWLLGYPPVAAQTLTVPEDVSVECSGSLVPTVLASATASDGCSVQSITYNDAENLTSCNNTGTIVRTWTATDDCGNAVSADQMITVVDSTPPELTVPGDIVVDCGGSIEPEVGTTGIATASDGCGTGLITANFQDDTSGLTGCSGTGVIIRTWRATDACGNEVTDTQMLSLQDVDPPTITCPADLSLGDNPSGDLPVVDLSLVTATDGCDSNPTIQHIDDVVTGSADCLYTVERSFSATDACGNSAECTQYIYYTVGGPAVTATPGECNPANQSYDLDIEVSFAGTGMFDVILNGVSLSTNPYSYEADGTTNITINGLPANGFSGITVEISDPATCSGIAMYNAPESCQEVIYDGEISGTVFLDLDADGVLDPGESGMSGVQVTLYPAGTNGGSTEPIVLYTDSDGLYLFAGLPPDDYTVVVGSGPAGYSITTSTTENEQLDNGETQPGNNFGFQPAVLPPLESCDVPDQTICTQPIVPNEICLPEMYTGPDWFINDYDVLYDCSLEVAEDCITYTALPGFEGTEFLVIQACNTAGECENYCTEIVVGTCNEPPVAVEDGGNTECGPITIAVLTNDYDPEGDPITICGYTQPLNGSVAQSGDFLVYTPFEGYNGNDIFTYDLCDDQGNLSTGTVSVAVNCTVSGNNPPSVIDDLAMTQCDSSVSIDALANDSDPDGDPLTICDNMQPFNGSVVLTDGVFVYTPNAGFDGNDVFVYQVCDTNGGQTSGIVTITVESCTAGNTAPVAVDDDISCYQDGQTIEVLANDTDADGDALFVCDFAQPAEGYVTLENNIFTYVANPAYTGTVLFLYSVCDDSGASSTAVVTLTHCEENQSPTAIDDSSVSNGDPITVDVVNNDVDPDGDPLIICDYTIPANGTVFPIDGAFLYTPNEGFEGTDTFEYTVCDDDGASDTALVTIIVTGGDCENITIYGCTAPIQALQICPSYCGLGNVWDITEVHNLYNCSIEIEEDCVFYTPLPGFYGQETLTITACNPDGICEEAVAIITVVDDCEDLENYPPNATDDVATSACSDITISPLTNDTDPDNDVISICSFTAPMYGSLQMSGDNFIYTPSSDYSGTDAFTYTICDPDGLQDTGTITITANCGGSEPNTPPVANDDSVTSNCTETSIDVLANDTDADGDILSICGLQQPQFGTLVQNGSTFSYTPNAGFTGTDVFLYSVCDPDGAQSTGVVTVVVSCGENNPPVAIDDNVSNACTSAAIDALSNDGDLDGDAIFLCNFTQPANGTLIQAGDNFIYTPFASFTGTDSFEYTICDGNGGEDTAMVSITVACSTGNNPPIATNDNMVTSCNEVSLDLASNDSDPDGDVVYVCASSVPTNGSLTMIGNMAYYTPNAGFVGSDAFTYTLCDGNGGEDTATVTVSVNCPNNANNNPTAVSDVANVACQASTINVLANDSDIDGDVISLCAVGVAVNGTVSQSGNSVIYTPNAGFQGADSFTYTICDGNGGQASATVSVSVNCQTNTNNNPTAVSDVANVACQASTINVLANDSDIDGDVISLCAVGVAVNGTVSQSGNSVIYTPNAGFQGADSFTYTICDGNGGQASATVSVSVNCQTNTNNNPTAVSDVANVACQASTINVLANDSDIDGDVISLCAVGVAVNGTVSQSGNSVIYTPNAGFQGADSFTYTICDGNGGQASATVSVSVSCSQGNTPPVATDDSGASNGDPITIGVITNDYDPDGDTVYICGNTGAVNGTVVQSGGSFIYTPNAGFVGTDSFTYTICDGNGGTDIATVVVTVGGSTGCIPEVITLCVESLTPTPICPDFCQLDGYQFTIVEVNSLYQCGIDIEDGCLIYTSLPGFPEGALQQLTIEACNLDNTICETVSVNITIGGCVPNDSPVAVDDSYSTPQNTAVTNNVLGNDYDPDNDPITICNYTQGTNGIVTVSGSGLVYTPNTGFTGVDSYSYSICDGNGNTDTATVTITVTGGGTSNNPPNAVDDYSNTNGTPVTISVLGNDSDPDGDVVYICGWEQASNGTVIQSGYGFVYSPNAGFVGTDVFSYTICDGNGGEDVAIVTITAGGGGGCNNESMFICTEPLTPTQICPTSCGLNAGWTVTNVTALYNCSLSISGQCITYTALPGFLGTESLTITMCDGANCETVVANVTVAADCNSTNTNPVAVDDSATSPSTGVTIPVLNNDYDNDGDALSFCGIGTGSNGTVTASGGSLVYMPNSGFSGTDSFTYTICDGNGGTDTAIVTVTVTGGCQETLDVCTAEMTPVDICIDFCGLTGPVMINMASTTYNCALGLLGGNCIRYTPLPGFNGSDTIEVLACDNFGNCTTAYVNMFVGDCSGNGGGNGGGGNGGGNGGGTGGNGAPYAIPDVVNTTANTGVNINVLANDSDPNGDPISLCGNTNVVNGTISQSGSGYYYQPNAGFVGVDNFYYTLCDSNGNSSLAEVTIYVGSGTGGGGNGGGGTGENGSPVANSDSVNTNVNTAVTVNVLANDNDPNGDVLSVCDWGVPTNGTVYQSGSSLVYTPSAGFIGYDTFIYTACDPSGASSSATVSVNVSGTGGGNGGGGTGGPCDGVTVETAYDYPTASIGMNTSYTYTGSCGSLDISGMVGPVNGTMTMTSDNSFTYTPNEGFVGLENLYFNSYTMVGTCGPYLCQVTALTITVTGDGSGGGNNGGGNNGGGNNGGETVVANDDYYTTLNTNPATILILQNDVYPSGVQNLTISAQPSSGTAMVNSNGTITYIPAPGFSGMVSFDYLLCVNGYCDPATVTISVEDNHLCELGNAPTIVTNGLELRGAMEIDAGALEECYAGGSVSLVIFNKDGKVIFEQEQRVSGFTGFDLGSLASQWGDEAANTYYYSIEAQGINTYKRDSGHIVLMR